VDLHVHSPIRLHGVVLNYLSTGTSLLLPYIREYNTNYGLLVKLETARTFQCRKLLEIMNYQEIVILFTSYTILHNILLINFRGNGSEMSVF
jgi:hypothetical protein